MIITEKKQAGNSAETPSTGLENHTSKARVWLLAGLKPDLEAFLDRSKQKKPTDCVKNIQRDFS